MRYLFTILLLLIPVPLHASEELRTVISEFAVDLQKLLDGQGEDSVAIGQFTGPANFPTSSGPGIAKLLADELEANQVQVKTRAKFGIKGAYRLIELPATDELDLRLGRKTLATEFEASVVDQFDRPLGDIVFKRQIRGEATVVELTGIPVSLPTDGNRASERERDQALRDGLSDPKPDLQGAVVRARAGSPYGMGVLVNGKPRAVTNRDGLPFVSIQRGEEYVVRLINESAFDAAVQLRIDGLSMFAFSEVRDAGKPRYSAVIVPARGEATIRGWHVTNEATDKFLVTEYAKSAAAALNHKTDIGTITATFQAAWQTSPPPDEPAKRKGGMGDATGRGDRIGEKFGEVSRQFGVIRDSVSVRYTK